MGNSDEIRQKIIGLGDTSWRKSYYPELIKQLRELESFKAMLNESEDIILLLKDSDGQVLDHNRSAQLLLGQDKKNLKGLTIKNLLPPEESKLFLDELQKMEHRRFLMELNLGFQLKKTIEFSLSHQTFDAERRVVAVGRDISQLMEFQRALREGEKRLDLALKGGNLGLWDLDLVHETLVTNEIWYTMLGYTPYEPKPSYELWESLVHDEDLDYARKVLSEHLEGKTDFYSAELRMKTAEGNWKWIHTRGRVSERDASGKALRITGTHQDIHQSRIMEERMHQIQKLESIGRLAGGIAHDFNNLLTIINIEAEILQEELKSFPQFKDDIDAIYDAGERGAQLTRQLLTFSRKQKGNPVKIDLNDTIRDLKKMMDRLLGSEIDLILKLEEKMPSFQFDKSQLEQILINLLVNARDAMRHNPPDRKKQITISTQKKDDKIQLKVEDKGKGMDEKIQKLIFDPFFTTKGEGKGTGLGLATVFGIISQNNGEIRVDSRINQGSTFTVILPQKQGLPS